MRVLLGMPLPMPCTKILTNKVAVTAIEVAVINLLRGVLSNISITTHKQHAVSILTIQLMSVEVLSSRVALVATLFRAFVFLVVRLGRIPFSFQT